MLNTTTILDISNTNFYRHFRFRRIILLHILNIIYFHYMNLIIIIIVTLKYLYYNQTALPILNLHIDMKYFTF